MMDRDPDFILSSTESAYLQALYRKCWAIKQIRSESRSDFLLMHVDIPIDGAHYKLSVPQVDTVLLCSRHGGVSLVPMSPMPIHVYVVYPLIERPEQRDVIKFSEMVLMDWGVVYSDAEQAEKDIYPRGRENAPRW